MARDDDAVSNGPLPKHSSNGEESAQDKQGAKPPAVPNLSIDDDEDDDRPRKNRRDDEDEDDDRPRKKSRSRDDDDDENDDRPRKKSRSRDDDDDDDDDRPRKKKRSRDDDEDAYEEDDRPRKKSRSRDDDDDADDDDRSRKKKRSRDEDDDDDRRGKKKKSKDMPGMLLGAAITAMVWGGLNIFSNCGVSLSSFNAWNSLRQVDRLFPGLGRLAEDLGGVGPGFYLTLGIVYALLVVASVLLTVGGLMLLMRKVAGKYLALAGCIAMLAIALGGGVVSLALSRFAFGGMFMGLPVSIFFTLCVGGFLIFALMDRDVNRALR
jgi:hypothetical protein